ncbi:hypothetical protein HPT29_000265 [Microvirga terrae]|uniref:Uncharacterized protein n=1 Tax=Microvirga terrae TaxID=2740529 RepID=A0ABY5RQW2_9HYPH|nr:MULTISPECIES: hypothetical protein [Microvirga]MBQ0820893.1 hypothetical protein [Microvirga sp. HBU67558]UVF19630.1 hypothetical protein HPT29_000265 [Microvirga terrae]
MTSNQEFKGPGQARLSPLDLKQIREAVSEVRASTPRSVLADLVEEKIRTLASDAPDPPFDVAPAQDWRLFG